MATKKKEFEVKKDKKPLTRKQVYSKALKMLEKASEDINALNNELEGFGMDSVPLIQSTVVSVSILSDRIEFRDSKLSAKE